MAGSDFGPDHDRHRTVVPYGEWPSPITAEAVVASASSPTDVRAAGGALFWGETRPEEGGRIALIRQSPNGDRQEVVPEDFSVRTRVHEYGGGAFTATDDAVFVVSWADQRLHRIDLGSDGSIGQPVPLTPEPQTPHGLRYADVDRHGDWVVCVRERHDGVAEGDDAVNEIVAVPVAGGEPVILVTGADFVSDPRISPDGSMLAWIEWDHPAMPWDDTRLQVAPIDWSGPTLGEAELVAGGPPAHATLGRGESITQARWARDGTLHFISDRSDWWNVERLVGSERVPVTEGRAEVGTPPWVFGMQRYCFLTEGRMAFAAAANGVDRLYVRHPGGDVEDLDVPCTEISSLIGIEDDVVFIGASYTSEPTIFRIDLDGSHGAPTVVREPRALPFGPSYFSMARPISFPSGPDGERTARANFYPPRNGDVDGPMDERPPLLVLIHGGPTAMARARLDVAKAFWTSRGFALVDVNYGGSTGFGRTYRDLLKGNWGVVDVEDCIAAVRYLADAGFVDGGRCGIRGGSAGGFTVLAALTDPDGREVFAVGASSYGVADLTALAEETHKFESRYLDGLVGPYPEARDVYEQRSPINHVDRLAGPLIVFQGLEDEIVPPNQSEMIVDAVKAKGLPVAYLAFEGEQHGFRKAETVKAVLAAELAFYAEILGFAPADDLPELDIANRPS